MMRALRFVIIGVALTFAVGTAAAATLGDAQVGFSAERTLVIDGHRYVGRIWTMPGKERHEQEIRAFRPVFLLRSDSPLGEVVLKELHTIVEFVVPPGLGLLGSPDLKKHPIGHDRLGGIAATKYAIDETLPEGHATGILWLSRDGIPLKLSGRFTARSGKVSTISWVLSHVRIGPQPEALFEPPHGFTKLPAEAVAPLLGMRLKSAPH